MVTFIGKRRLPARSEILATGVFQPSDIAGLRADWDPAKLALSDTDPVSSLTDQTGNAFHATNTGSGRPVFTANVANSKPGIVFSGGQWLETASIDLLNNADTFSVFAWLSVAPSQNQFYEFYTTNPGMPEPGPNFAGNNTPIQFVYYYDDADTPSGFVGDAPVNYNITRDTLLLHSVVKGTTTMKLWEGATLIDSKTGLAEVKNGSCVFGIGARTGGIRPAGMTLVRLLVYNAAVSDANRALLAAYGTTQYGI